MQDFLMTALAVFAALTADRFVSRLLFRQQVMELGQWLDEIGKEEDKK